MNAGPTFSVIDASGAILAVGTRVIFGAPATEAERYAQIGTVTQITEPDVDYDDDLMRPVQYCPRVTIALDNGDTEDTSTVNITHVTWADYPDGPAHEEFQCEDVEVISPTLAEARDKLDPANADYARDEDEAVGDA